ncbi:hypothetical protein P879_07058 [Paragonimus westermani]|uniref:Uncharacterized protein n=1 Tax=Paragonimus westermani TaxID=34504 RepID=A0A8T0DE40_9TREM|nr:hypothetical protein P879_07058 [Paragonimus westermani]
MVSDSKVAASMLTYKRSDLALPCLTYGFFFWPGIGSRGPESRIDNHAHPNDSSNFCLAELVLRQTQLTNFLVSLITAS